MKYISILGSSGSIGVQALGVIDALNKKQPQIKIAGLTSYSNIGLLKEQILKYKPLAVSIWEKADKETLTKWAKQKNINIKIYSGIKGLIKTACLKKSDTVLSSVVGAVGVLPVIEAVKCGKNIALANKEALVMAGNIIMPLAKKHNVEILPVDSEHSAIFQCLQGQDAKNIKRIILTASGGPFYRYDKDFKKITLQKALLHPTWKMGRKITIDSATLMNKGLEAIEASHLFNIDINKIDIVIHPQSIVHSMVEFNDGSVIAQMSVPDMRLPIQYALMYPQRRANAVPFLDLTKEKKLEFFKPDFKKFKCLSLAYKAAAKDGTMPAVLNAANETAVKAFLEEKIKFTDIAYIVEKVMSKIKTYHSNKIEDYIEADFSARQLVQSIIQKGGKPL